MFASPVEVATTIEVSLTALTYPAMNSANVAPAVPGEAMETQAAILWELMRLFGRREQLRSYVHGESLRP